MIYSCPALQDLFGALLVDHLYIQAAGKMWAIEMVGRRVSVLPRVGDPDYCYIYSTFTFRPEVCEISFFSLPAFFSVRVKDKNHYDFFELKLEMRLRAQTLQLADSEREG